MLSLVGLGVAYDITLEGLSEAKKSDELYLESYTMPMEEKEISRLEKIAGRKFMRLPRDKVESKFLVERAKENKVCLLVVGDPLSATTHAALLIDAKKAGIPVRVIHNSSILSAAPGKSGLQPYRFGKTVTLAYWRKNYEPVSPLQLIEQNLSMGMHTLLLLDLDPLLGPMDARAALDQLDRMEKKYGKKVFSELVVLSRVGHPDEKISFGTRASLKKKNLGKPPSCFCIPAKLHPVEEECLSLLKPPSF
ncbi:MAG: diphthine synthase [Candidatus ainarchaeum sp.]|nr:diphthine synthase [Candidatus ainarchaeum sp.]